MRTTLTKPEIIRKILVYRNEMKIDDTWPDDAELKKHKLMRYTKERLCQILQKEKEAWYQRAIVVCFASGDRYRIPYEPDTTIGEIMKNAQVHFDEGVIHAGNPLDGVPTSEIDMQQTLEEFCSEHNKSGRRVLFFDSYYWIRYYEWKKTHPFGRREQFEEEYKRTNYTKLLSIAHDGKVSRSTVLHSINSQV